MEFNHYDLGRLGKDCTVEITLEGNAVNVQLLDDINFNRYRNGLAQYSFVGGRATQSPVRLKTSHEGHWHVTLDFRDLAGGKIKSSVRVLPAGQR